MRGGHPSPSGMSPSWVTLGRCDPPGQAAGAGGAGTAAGASGSTASAGLAPWGQSARGRGRSCASGKERRSFSRGEEKPGATPAAGSGEVKEQDHGAGAVASPSSCTQARGRETRSAAPHHATATAAPFASDRASPRGPAPPSAPGPPACSPPQPQPPSAGVVPAVPAPGESRWRQHGAREARDRPCGGQSRVGCERWLGRSGAERGPAVITCVLAVS